MKKIRTVCAILIILMILTAGAGCKKTPPPSGKKEPQMQFYENALYIHAATTGSDSNGGTSEKDAFLSVAKALERVKEVQTSADIEGCDAVVVKLGAGVFTLSGVLEITPAHTAALPLVFEGVTNKTVLSGGYGFQGGWTLHDAAKNIYKISTAAFGAEDFRQLYVDGVPGIRARFPSNTGEPEFDTVPVIWDESGRKICVSESLTDGHLSEAAGAEIHVVQDWAQSVCIVQDSSVADGVRSFTVDEFTRDIIFNRAFPERTSRQRCWFENSYAFLDAPGEWYLDKAGATLFYLADAGEDVNTKSFTVPKLETLFCVKGSRDNPVKGVYFDAVTFSDTGWTYPGGGYVDGQAGIYATSAGSLSAKGPAGVEAEYVHDLIFFKTVFKNMGSCGLNLSTGVKDAKVIGSRVHRIAGSGISIGHFLSTGSYYPNTKDITERIEVENCYISGIGISFKGGSTGIVSGYAREISIRYNTIHDVSYSGIALGWGWMAEPNVTSGLNVEGNRIYDCMNYLAFDGSEIYLLGRRDPDGKRSTVKYNYITCENSLGGLYFDEGSCFYTAEDNVIEGMGKNGIVNFHDLEYAVSDITLRRTYGISGGAGTVHFQSYSRAKPPKTPVPLSERRVVYDEVTAAKIKGEWNASAQGIMDEAGPEKEYKSFFGL